MGTALAFLARTFNKKRKIMHYHLKCSSKDLSSERYDGLYPSPGLAVPFCLLSSLSCQPSTEPRDVEDSDAFSSSGSGATTGGAWPFFILATVAESSSQLFFSSTMTDRTHRKVMAAQIPAHRNGTPHPEILLLSAQRGSN